jgi:hypothetical protein
MINDKVYGYDLGLTILVMFKGMQCWKLLRLIFKDIFKDNI